jgi:ribosome modulation factor
LPQAEGDVLLVLPPESGPCVARVEAYWHPRGRLTCLYVQDSARQHPVDSWYNSNRPRNANNLCRVLGGHTSTFASYTRRMRWQVSLTMKDSNAAYAYPATPGPNLFGPLSRWLDEDRSLSVSLSTSLPSEYTQSALRHLHLSQGWPRSHLDLRFLHGMQALLGQLKPRSGKAKKLTRQCPCQGARKCWLAGWRQSVVDRAL